MIEPDAKQKKKNMHEDKAKEHTELNAIKKISLLVEKKKHRKSERDNNKPVMHTKECSNTQEEAQVLQTSTQKEKKRKEETYEQTGPVTELCNPLKRLRLSEETIESENGIQDDVNRIRGKVTSEGEPPPPATEQG